jgi:hypothetical protein
LDRRIVPLLLLALALLLPQPRAAEAAPPIMPLAEVRPGMEGYGLTVFSGDRPERFGVRLLGVLRDARAGRSVILARMSDPESHVLQGMSGSPVFIGDRLVGAMSMAFPYATDPYFGITPIEDMLGLLAEDAGPGTTPESNSRPQGASRATAARQAPAAITTGAETLAPFPALEPPPRSLLALEGIATTDLRFLPGLELHAPVSLSGERTPPSETGEHPSPAAEPFEPGSPIEVPLMRGDRTMGALGTVTWVDQGRLLAFGHGFLEVGGEPLPVATAWVHASIPSVQLGFKLGSLGEVVGSLTRDSQFGIAGRLGPAPTMVDCRIRLRGPNRSPAETSYELVRFTPLTAPLALLALDDALRSWLKGSGGCTLRGELTITLADRPPLRLTRLAVDERSPTAAAQQILQPLFSIYSETFDPVELTRVDLDLEVADEVQLERLTALEISPRRARAGESLRVLLEFKRYEGPTRRQELEIELPPGLPEGEYQLRVMDSQAYERWRAQRRPRRGRSLDLETLLQRLDEAARPDLAHLLLIRPTQGMSTAFGSYPSVAGRWLKLLRQAPRTSDHIWWRGQVVLHEPLELSTAVQADLGLKLPIRD